MLYLKSQTNLISRIKGDILSFYGIDIPWFAIISVGFDKTANSIRYYGLDFYPHSV